MLGHPRSQLLSFLLWHGESASMCLKMGILFSSPSRIVDVESQERHKSHRAANHDALLQRGRGKVGRFAKGLRAGVAPILGVGHRDDLIGLCVLADLPPKVHDRGAGAAHAERNQR